MILCKRFSLFLGECETRTLKPDFCREIVDAWEYLRKREGAEATRRQKWAAFDLMAIIFVF